MQRITQSPTDPGFVQNPYRFYDQARAMGDLVWWEDYAMPVATTHRAVMAILKDRQMGRAPLDPPQTPQHLAPFYAIEAHSMLELEPPRHTRLRGLVLRAFTSRRIATLAPEIEALCHRLIDRFPDAPFDLLPAYAQHVPVTIIARLLGVPESMADQLLDWSNAMVAMYQARRDRAVEEAAAAAATDFSAFLQEYVAARRSKPADDLITHLIAAEEDGTRLSTDELITTCILLLNAGHEATVHSLGNGVKAVLESPGEMLAARSEDLAEEVLRFDPPLHMFTRTVYEDTEVFSHRLKRGDTVGALLGAANRDPAVWDAPGRFDPGRQVGMHAGFGAGLHFCVGAPLARLELAIGLRTLFARCPALALSSEPHYANLYHFHGLRELMVTR
ncbi:MAG: cytochrome P450 [Pseudomonadota bacterium]